jgi:hypothetical protein
MSSIDFSYTDFFIGKTVSLSLGADGNPLSPEDQRAQIKRPLELVKALPWLFSLRSPVAGSKLYLRESQPLLCSLSAQHPSYLPVRIMFGFVAIACPRLVDAPRNMHVPDKTTWRCAGWVMDRVTRGHVRRVQVRRQQRVIRAFDALFSKRWLIFGHVSPNHISSNNRAHSSPRSLSKTLQAAAAARVAGQPDILTAAKNGHSTLVYSHVVVDAECVNNCDSL